MKQILKRLLGLPPAPDAQGAGPTATRESPLKKAFAQAREQRNIDLVLPVFQQARLFVVAASQGAAGDLGDLFLVSSPGGEDRLCVTVSERQEWLSAVKWPKRSTTGRALLDALPSTTEITIVYADGGDFITREQRQWYAQLAAGAKTG